MSNLRTIPCMAINMDTDLVVTNRQQQRLRFDRSQNSRNKFSVTQTLLLAVYLSVFGLLLITPPVDASSGGSGCKGVSPIDRRDAVWGKVTSVNYPEPPTGAVCQQWTIYAKANYTITISFEDVDIPSKGNCSDNQLIIGPSPDVVICGEITDHRPVTYISGKDQLWMRFNFRGDHYVGRGFSLTYVTGPKVDPSFCLRTTYPSWRCHNGKCIHSDWQCNGADECGDGSDEQDCPDGLHLLTTPAPYDCGSDRFGCFDYSGRYTCFPMENQCDSVPQCLDGQDESQEKCGDANICTKALEGPHKHLTSPNFPNAYPNGVDCEWYLHVNISKHIQLRFDVFQLASRPNDVAGDYVVVYDGGSAEDNVLGRYYGNEVPPKLIESTGNRMYIIFHSDSRDAEQGFNASFQQKGACWPHQSECQWGEENCYEPEDKCDGHWDCELHGGDERGCAQCASDQFSCEANDRCYQEKDHCNGANRCFNHKDEADCTSRVCNADNGTFLCRNGKCIYESWQCDRTNDCGDNSDEAGCSALPSTKVITAAVIGSLICGLLLVIALGCTCKLHALRTHGSYSYRHSSPQTRLQDEIWIRQSAPPPYNEAMLTSRPFIDVQREVLEQLQREGGRNPPQQDRARRNRGSRSRERRHGTSRSGQGESQTDSAAASAEQQQETTTSRPNQNNTSSGGATNPTFVADDDDDVQMLDDGDIFNDDDDVALIDALGGHHGPLEIEQLSLNSESVSETGDSNVQICVATGSSAQWRRSRSKTPSGNSVVSTTDDCDTNNTQGDTASASNEIIISVDEEGNKDITPATFHQSPANDTLSGDLELTSQRLGPQSHDSDGSDGQSFDSDGTDIRSMSTANTEDL